jgi:glutathione synthase/RimK-type ligase-like ATP-grasp enzyme
LRRCAFLTLEDRSGFYIYDHLLFAPLRALGWSAEEIPWSRPGVDWSVYDAVIIRSTWDYQNHLETFLATLARIDAVTLLLNPLEICRWNSHKGYLRELAGRGVPTVPSLWEPALSRETLHAAARRFGSEHLVVKPCVGANADDTFPLRLGEPAGWGSALDCFGSREVIIQPFIQSVVSEGEYSLFYFADGFSHAILKQPAAGDFRVQEEHGGLITPAEAPREIRAAAQSALAALGQTLLYARLDFVTLDDGSPALIEMELIEPSLYFEQCDEAPGRFAEAFARMVGH